MVAVGAGKNDGASAYDPPKVGTDPAVTETDGPPKPLPIAFPPKPAIRFPALEQT
jgi:hypothetical protein